MAATFEWRAFATRFAQALLAAAFVISLAAPAEAQRSRRNEEEASDDGDRTFSRQIGEIVIAAQEAMSEEPPNMSRALDQLNRAINDSDISPYELGVVLMLRGNAYYELDQPQNTIQDWTRARRDGDLSPDEDMNLLFNIGQLHLQQENYGEAANMLEEWLRRGGEATDQVHLNLVAAYSELNQLSRALPHGRAAFNLASPRERRHYDVLNYLYTELNMPRERAALLQEMVQIYPQDRSIWLSIAALYAEAGREDRAFEINKIMYLNGMMNTEREIMRVVDYYSFYEVPIRGARILEREMNAGRVERTRENYEKLARLYRQAREFDLAIAPLTRAAQMSGNGLLYQQLGEAHYAEGELEEAETALVSAINRGGLRVPGNAWVVVGNSRYERGDRAGAIEAFTEALEFSHSEDTAQGWIDFINAEIESIEAREAFEIETQREAIRVACRRLMRDEVVLSTRIVELGEQAYFIEDASEEEPIDCRLVMNDTFWDEADAAAEAEAAAEDETAEAAAENGEAGEDDASEG